MSKRSIFVDLNAFVLSLRTLQPTLEHSEDGCRSKVQTTQLGTLMEAHSGRKVWIWHVLTWTDDCCTSECPQLWRTTHCGDRTTARVNDLTRPHHPGELAQNLDQPRHFQGQIWSSLSPAACTAWWHLWCPSCHLTWRPRKPGKGLPQAPDRDAFYSPASGPN